MFFLDTAFFLPAPLRLASACALPAIGLMGRAAYPAGASPTHEAELFATEPAELTRFGLIFALTYLLTYLLT